MNLLMGLPTHWSTAREQVISAHPQLELGSVIAALENRKDLISPPITASASGTGNTEALISTEGLQEKPYR